MDDKTALLIIDKIFQTICEQPKRLSLDELFQKLATDMRLPHSVTDAITGDTTWSITNQSQNFITQSNVSTVDKDKGWIKPRQKINDITEL